MGTTDVARRRLLLRRGLTWLSLALALAGAVRLGVGSAPIAGIDFYQFWALAQAVDEGLVENIYHPSSRRTLARLFLKRSLEQGSSRQRRAAVFRKDDLQAAATPFLYTVFHAAASGSYDRDIGTYRALTLLGSLVSTLVLCRMLGASPLATAATLAFVTWLWAPLRDDLADGNVNQIQLCLMTLFLCLQRRAERRAAALAAGFVLGAACFFKPNLAFVFVALAMGWAAGGRWLDLLRCSAGIGAGAVCAVVGSSLFFGSASCWLDWLEVFRRLDEHFDVAVRWGNFGGARLLQDALGWDLSPLLNLLGLGALGAAAWASRIGSSSAPARFRREFLLVGIGAVLPLLSMGLAWPHYLMLAVPLALFVFVGRTAALSTRLSAPVLLVACLALAGLASTRPLEWLDVRGPYLRAIPLASGCALLFGLGLWELWRGSGEAGGATTR